MRCSMLRLGGSLALPILKRASARAIGVAEFKRPVIVPVPKYGETPWEPCWQRK